MNLITTLVKEMLYLLFNPL